jgi:hypothetical protein
MFAVRNQRPLTFLTLECQEIDESAPSIWKEQMTEERLEFDCISDEDKRALKSWSEKRRVLLQRRVQEEIEAELQMDESLLRQSKPFIRVKVHSVAGTESVDMHSELAMLTIWDPSEEQLDLLKEGSTIEVQDVAVRSVPFDGLLQLTINGRTALRRAESDDTEILQNIRYQARSALNLFQVHALSHALQREPREWKTSKPFPTFDTVGIMACDLRSSTDENPGYEVHLTDESCLSLRVHFHKIPYELKRKLMDPLEPSARVIALNDLQVLPFDTTMNCAVAKYSTLSSVFKDSIRQARLVDWMKRSESENSLLRVCGHVKASLPRSLSGSSFSTVGSIVGASAPGGTTLKIEVDCGVSVEEWILPTCVLQSIHESLEDSSPAAFLESYESRLSEMRTLDLLFRARSVTWRFDVALLSSNCTSVGCCSFVVQNISRFDARNLALLQVGRESTCILEDENPTWSLDSA